MEASENIVAAVLAHALIGRLGREPDAKVAVMTWREVLKAIRTVDAQGVRSDKPDCKTPSNASDRT
jgi:hypothetical protein